MEESQMIKKQKIAQAINRLIVASQMYTLAARNGTKEEEERMCRKQLEARNALYAAIGGMDEYMLDIDRIFNS